MPTDKLTDAKCRSAKAAEKAYKLFDGGGMHLYVSPTGARVWRLAYRRRVNGELKQATISFGPYPEVGLAEARRQRADARQMLRNGADPMAPRRVAKSLTLRDACDAYWSSRQDITDAYRLNATRCMEMHIYPALGDQAIATITRTDLLAPLNKMNAAGLYDYVRKARMWLSSVFARGIAQGTCEHNPAAEIDAKNAFGNRRRVSFAAVQPNEVAPLMARLALEDDTLQSMLACRFLAYTLMRTNEMRKMLWSDIIQPDLLMIPAERMKSRRDHLVPLSTQAQEIITQMRARSRGSRYVWPGDRSLDRTMSENAVLYLLHRVGYKDRMTGHGWRSTGSTWANEAGWNPDAIELQLAHVDSSVRAIYNRARYLDERRSMLQAWGDWLDAQGHPQPAE